MNLQEGKLKKYNVELWYIQDTLFGAERLVYQSLVRTINYFDKDGNRAPNNYSWISIGTLADYEHLDKRTVSKAIHSLADKNLIFLEPRFKKSYIIKLNHEVFGLNEKHEGRVRNAPSSTFDTQEVVQKTPSKIQSVDIVNKDIDSTDKKQKQKPTSAKASVITDNSVQVVSLNGSNESHGVVHLTPYPRTGKKFVDEALDKLESGLPLDLVLIKYFTFKNDILEVINRKGD